LANIAPDKPLFPIGVVAEMLDIPQRVLRAYEEKEVIKPSRSQTGRRLYSHRDIQRIEYIHYLNRIRKVNLSGVKEIFNLLAKINDEESDKILAEFQDEVSKASSDEKMILSEQ
jgi:MerR family transcriptional regulator/heat shock protein HspR